MERYHLIFYKDGAFIVTINLLNGNYFIPSIESEKKDIKKNILKKYSVSVLEYDLIEIDYKYYLFIGEWEGLYSIDDDVYRSKWVPVSSFKEREILEIRKRYRDIVDRNGEVIGIASIGEAETYNLRKRQIKHNGKYYDLLLGESPEEACKRLKIKYKTITPIIETNPEKNAYVYRINK